jgi:hypothetical protein
MGATLLSTTSPYAAPRHTRDRYLTLKTRLWSERASFDASWRELADYIAPRRVRFTTTDRNRGERRDQFIIDSTARFSARTLASGLHSGLTSPARPWFKLTTPDPDLAESPDVKIWLHTVTDRLRVFLAGSNVYNMLPILYGDMGTFGSSAMAIVEDPKTLVRCYAYPLGSWATGLDARQRTTTFVREFQLTVRQIVEMFARQGREIDWSVTSTTVRNLWDRGDYEASVDVCWTVMPNEDARPHGFARHLPWISTYCEIGQEARDTMLQVSGFHEFPVVAPRWDVTGEDTYGTDCPGMTAIGDVKQLQIMERRKGQAIAKQINPPLQAPETMRSQKPSVFPGDVSYVDLQHGKDGFRAIYEVELNLANFVADQNLTRQRIQRAYFEDLFLMLAQSQQVQPITAAEVAARQEEKLIVLGPVLERTNDELLSPLIDRTYAIAARAGLLPEPPDALDGVELKIEYTSILAEAMKLVGVAGLDRFVSTIGAIAQTYPEVRHKIKPFQLVNDYADMLGVDPRILQTDEDATAAAQAEAQAQKDAADAVNNAANAKAARDAAAAPLGTNSALDRVVTTAAAQQPGGVPA